MLRIVAMMMIVGLHHMSHGGILNAVKYPESSFFIAWMLEAFCIVAVNVYVLISGYFLIHSKFKIKKIIVLWSAVFFYSIVIYLILVGSGNSTFEISKLIKSLFPVSYKMYWFATAYIGLYCLSPLLNHAIRVITKKQMQIVIGVLIALFCIWNDVIPLAAPLETAQGYSIIWFVCLYFIAAYIRLYHNFDAKSKKWYLLCYIISAIILTITKFVLYIITTNIGVGEGYTSIFYRYNSFFVLVASISIFLYFTKVEIKNSWINKVIITVAPLTFGIYLIHDNPMLRKVLWQLLHTSNLVYTNYFIAQLVCSVLGVFICCAVIELLRGKIFTLWEKQWWFEELCEKIENSFIKIFNRIVSNQTAYNSVNK